MGENRSSRSVVFSLLLAAFLVLPLGIRLLFSREIEMFDTVIETYREGLVSGGLALHTQNMIWGIPEAISTEWTEDPYSMMKVVLGILFVLKGSMAVLLVKFM